MKYCFQIIFLGGPLGDEENIPAKVYEKPELKQPDPGTLILVWLTILIGDWLLFRKNVFSGK